MSSYVVQIKVVGHTANKGETEEEEAELLEEAKFFVEHLLDLGHGEVVGGLRIDGASAIDLVPTEEERAVVKEELGKWSVSVRPPTPEFTRHEEPLAAPPKVARKR